jgi:DNA polymerase I-like protein with 3'-5' exonuclease and polymerase domains/uracil-DNA glycosylase
MIYVGSTGPAASKLMIVGEAPGENDEFQGVPFSGASGTELAGEMHEVGLLKADAFITNACRFKPPFRIEDWVTAKKKLAHEKGMAHLPGTGFWVEPFILDHVATLRKEIELVKPNVIVALGNFALLVLTGKWGVHNWQGSEMACTLTNRPDGKPYKVIPLIHPANIFAQYKNRYFNVHNWRKVKRELATPDLFIPDYHFQIRPTFNQVVDQLQRLLGQLAAGPLRLSLDLETKAHKWISCIGLAWSRTEALCIPFLTKRFPFSYWSEDEELCILEMLGRIVRHPNAQIVGQNLLYDMQYIAKWWGLGFRPYLDTMIAHHTAFPGLEKGLDTLAMLYCNHYTFWKQEGKDEGDVKATEEEFWTYNCKDVCYTYEVSEEVERVIAGLKLQRQCKQQHDIMMAAFKMMLRGVRRDLTQTQAVAKELEMALDERLSYLASVLGHKLNPRSPKQLSTLFYNDFGQAVVKDRKTKKPTTKEEALEQIGKREALLRPVCQAINEHRSLGVFKSTFVDAKVDWDERIRCSNNVAGAETFRWSSSTDAFDMGGNLQNIPKGGSSKIAAYVKQHGPTPAEILMDILKLPKEKFWKQLEIDEAVGAVSVDSRRTVYYRLQLPNIRKLFLPDPGYVIADWDLDRADLYVVVWEANDLEMKQILREGADMHSINAKALGCSRDMAKRFVHGTNYGGSARTMAANCGLTTQASEVMQRRWFQAHPGIKEWHRRTEASLKANRSVSNRFGYIRYYFDRIEQILPQALAWVPQSTVAIVINTALVNINKNLPQVEVLLQVHDSLVFQYPESLHPSIESEIREQMRVVVPYPDPLVIPASGKASRESWGAIA